MTGSHLVRKIVLISIRPVFVQRIFDGSKKVELRRVKPKIQSGDVVVIYATAPVKAVVGWFEVSDIVSESPPLLWSLVSDKAGVTFDEFSRYYEGAGRAIGIECRNAQQLSQPLKLDYLRQYWHSFTPPQLYRYLTYEEFEFVRKDRKRVELDLVRSQQHAISYQKSSI